MNLFCYGLPHRLQERNAILLLLRLPCCFLRCIFDLLCLFRCFLGLFHLSRRRGRYRLRRRRRPPPARIAVSTLRRAQKWLMYLSRDSFPPSFRRLLPCESALSVGFLRVLFRSRSSNDGGLDARASSILAPSLGGSREGGDRIRDEPDPALLLRSGGSMLPSAVCF